MIYTSKKSLIKSAAGSNHHEVAGSNQYTIYLLNLNYA
jgi:hypothetical protein